MCWHWPAAFRYHITCSSFLSILVLVLFANVTGTTTISSLLRGQQEDQNENVTIYYESQQNRRQLKSAAPKTAKLDKRVALLQVHFEGNVGDQMETIPLLKRLHGKINRQIDR